MKNEIMRLAEAMAVAMAGEKDAVALIEARAVLEAAVEKLTAERDALKDAARLALDALEAAQWKNWRTDKAIAALKAVL